MTVRKLGVWLVTAATVIGLILTVTGVDRDGSYWHGIGLVLLLISVAVLIAGDVIEGRRK